jgi:formate dehydrogenase gamma subunit
MSSVIDRNTVDSAAVEPVDRILRFRMGDRIEHAIQLITFVVLGLTGLIQKFFEAGFSRWMIEFLGGLPRVRYIHRFFATVLMVAVIYHLGKAGYRKFVERRPKSMVPGRADWVAIKQSVAYLVGRRDEPAPQGRFTFAEKVEYWSFVWGTVLMIITGYMLWNPITTAKILPGDFIPAAKAAHGGEALLAVLAILVWHIYHVHVKHFNKSIFNGYLSREEMLEEHPLELEAIEAGTAGPRTTPEERQERRKWFLPAFAVIAIVLLGGTWWFISYEETAIGTIEPIEEVTAFKPLPPEGIGHVTPPLSEENPFPEITTTVPGTEDTTPPPTTGEVSWTDSVAVVLASGCGSCHSQAAAMGGIDLSTFEAVMAIEGLVVPGDPTVSSLVTVQEAGGHPGQLDADDLAAVRDWIEQGAPLNGTAAPDLSWEGAVGDTVILRCGACHSDTTAAGGIDLSTYSAAMSSSGLIVPGDPDASTLVQVQQTGGHPGQFTDDELAIIIEWVSRGAP